MIGSPASDPIRDALQAIAARWAHKVTLATILVAIGVVMEAAELVHLAVKRVRVWISHRREKRDSRELREIFPSGDLRHETASEHEPTWVKVFLRVGVILVAIGVIGEWRYGERLEEAHNAVHEYDLRKLTEADQKAGEAAKSARIAHEEADAVGKQADAQGPRAKLLLRVAPDLARKLASFEGQRVGLFVCGQQGLAHQETLDAWGVIANILDSDTVSGVTGAKWKEVPNNLNWAGNCGAASGLGQGIIVFVSKRASTRTMEAANELGHGIAEALPPSPNKMPSLIDPVFSKFTVDRGFQHKNAPWVSAGLDPDLITVLIGEHP